MDGRSGFKLTLSLQGLGGVQTSLAGLRRKVVDASPAFSKIDKSVTMMFKRQFDTEGAFGGTPWKPLAPATIKARAKPGRGRGGILRDFNTLWASLVNIGDPDGIRLIEPLRYTRGTRVPYAQAHQEGKVGRRTTRTGKKVGSHGKNQTRKMTRTVLPRRPIIPDPMPDHITRVWEGILASYFAEGN